MLSAQFTYALAALLVRTSVLKIMHFLLKDGRCHQIKANVAFTEVARHCHFGYIVEFHDDTVMSRFLRGVHYLDSNLLVIALES